MKYFFLLFFSLLFLFVSSQSKTDLYIEKYADLAVAEMNEFGVPASITLSQGILESGNGESRLATEGNNHFGIKCHDWEGAEIYADDDDENECFRKYKKVKQSYRDHSLFLSKRGRYSSLFELELTDYKGWAKGLKKAGYATNPAYADNLISLIERYDLQQFDKGISEQKQQELFVTHTYGFPFAYGVGLNYFVEDEYYVSAGLNSSFIFSGASVGGGMHLFDKLYGSVSVTGIYAMFAKDETQRFDLALSPQLNYVLHTKNKKILINAGVLFPLMGVVKKDMIPTFSLTYLLN
ncbi:MAG: glycoside hydrolase family 73 protein [Flavobacteriales bacterium]